MTKVKKRDGLIINNPKLMKIRRRTFEFLITIIGWYIWCILLIQPCIQFIDNYKNHQLNHFFSIQFIDETFYLYQLFLSVVLLILLILFWNRFNVRKFRGKDRRSSPGDVTSNLLGKYYRIPEKDVVAIQKTKRISIAFYDDKRIVINNDIEGLFAPDDISLHLKNINKA